MQELVNHNFENNRIPLKNIRAENLNKETSKSNEFINPFSLLEMDIECYKCHNYGHKAWDCKNKPITAHHDESKGYSPTNTTQMFGRKRPKKNSKKNAIWPYKVIMNFLNTWKNIKGSL